MTKDRSSTLEKLTKINEVLGTGSLRERFDRIVRFSRQVRVSEYHVTNACNIRCKGCWFFEYGHDDATRENKDLATLAEFLQHERTVRKVNTALVIGGEPTLFPERIEVFVEKMAHVTISTNGLKRFPYEGFEQVAVGLTLFGGGPLDDDLRAIKPGGRRFTGLFDTVLKNYRNDERAGFIYAITEDGIDYIEDTVRRIEDNGNRVNFNFYSKYGTATPSALREQQALLDKALEVKEKYPEAVVSHPYYIRTMITGRSHWGDFGYDTCPSVSVDYPEHKERLQNGNPTLPFFNTWAADLKTVKFCCTSGHCSGCRDSQAISSWLVVNMERFLESREMIETWIEVAESYWRQFIWGPFHWTKFDASAKRPFDTPQPPQVVRRRGTMPQDGEVPLGNAAVLENASI
jgi:Radical SAM superfamily